MRPVCCKCHLEMRPDKNGVAVEVMASFGSFKLIQADRYKCPGCGVQIITGFARVGIEHFEPDYQHFLELHAPTFRVWDRKELVPEELCEK